MRRLWPTAIRHRALQAVAIALLSALVTTCVVFAPLYDRAMQQAVTFVGLHNTPDAVRGLRLTSNSSYDVYDAKYHPQRSVSNLADVLPKRDRRSYDPPVAAITADAVAHAPKDVAAGSLQWRAGDCRHLVFVQGRCPAASREIAISSADVVTFGLAVGAVVPVDGRPEGELHPRVPSVPMTVVGVYRQPHDPWWFGQLLTGSSGQVASLSPRMLRSDDWITAAATFSDPSVPVLDAAASHVDYPLDIGHVKVDQLLALDRSLGAVLHDVQRSQHLQDVRVYTGLPDVANDVRHQQAQSRVTVPLLMVQLALLGVVVLWLVLGAATEQRRPEVAVAMLRGRGRVGARAFLLRELVPTTVAGVPLGVAAALGLAWLARDVLLPGSAPFEWLRGAWLALAASVLVLVVVVVLAVLAVTREPVERLLRRVPVRRAGWRLGALESLLVAMAGTAVVAFVSGGLTGPIALAGPVLLALVVGLVLSHLTAPVSGRFGRRLLAHGRVAAGVSVLDAARTPATRRAIAIVTVSTALLVFAMTALAVGQRNRVLAAEQVAGAPVTAPVDGNDLAGVRRALSQVDPSGRRVTPVVFLHPSVKGSQETVAAVPAALRRIAIFPGRHGRPPDLTALDPPRTRPLGLRGDTLSVHVLTRDLRARDGAQLQLALVDHDGSPGTVTLGALPTGAGEHALDASALLHCEEGCALTGVSVLTGPGELVRGSVVLSELTTSRDGVPTSIPLGPGTQWSRLDDRARGAMLASSPDGRSLALRIATAGAKRTTVTQRWVPQYLPTVVVGRLPAGARRPHEGTDVGATYTLTGIDGLDRPARATGRLPRVPRGGDREALVNLDVLLRGTAAIDPTARIEVWFAHDDPSLVRRVATALGAQGGSRLGRPLPLTDVRRRYDQSTSAWSLALGVVVAMAALLLALLVVALLAATTWRSRSRDLAALRLSGLRTSDTRRIATLAQLPALGLAVVAGTISGVVGAQLTMPRVPLFASAPTVSTLDLGVPWADVGLAAGVSILLLLLAGWYAGTAIAHRADLNRVRETL